MEENQPRQDETQTQPQPDTFDQAEKRDDWTPSPDGKPQRDEDIPF